jgi:hypothetical protein
VRSNKILNRYFLLRVLPFRLSSSRVLSPRRCEMVDTRRSAAAKRPAGQQEEEEGGKSSTPAPAPADQAAGAGEEVAAAQPPKRAKVRISLPCTRCSIGPGSRFGF